MNIAAAFLGTQGDQWDTQWDMLLALSGAIAAQLLPSHLHNRELTRFTTTPPPHPPAANTQ